MIKPLAFTIFVTCVMLLPYFLESGFSKMGLVDGVSIFLFFVLLFWTSMDLNNREKNKSNK
jgi:hypothetical protein